MKPSDPLSSELDDLFGRCDDTLADAPVPPPATPEEREWLANQRYVHGLLRSMHTSDAIGNEARVESILAAVESVAIRPRTRWLHVAAAALAISCSVGFVLFMDRLPEAEAAVQRGVDMLGESVDRRFLVASIGRDSLGRTQVMQEFELLARPGMKFVMKGGLTMGPLHFAEMRFGCDGSEFWFTSHNEGGEAVNRSGPLDEAPHLLRGIGNVLDLGLLDVHAVVRQLPRDFKLRTLGRERDESGQSLVRVEATGGPHRPGFHLHRADLWCNEATGMIVRLEVEADDGLGHLQRMSFHHLGPAEVDPHIYKRPW